MTPAARLNHFRFGTSWACFCCTECTKEEERKTAIPYRCLKRYEVSIEEDENFNAPVTVGKTSYQHDVKNKNLFYVLHEAHLNTEHGGKRN
jgi:hypothetical protein